MEADRDAAPETLTESSSFSAKEEKSDRAQNTELWPEYCNPYYSMPAEIEVRVMIGADQYFFPVGIVKATDNSKLYLGGYRNKLNGKVYHHASTQTPTDQQKKQRDYSNLRSRETQTVETKTLSVQVSREAGTQMERIDLRIDNKRDRELAPGRYFTSDELFLRKKAAVVSMQRYWRGYRARCLAEEIRQRNVAYHNMQTAQAAERRQADEAQRTHDMARRLHPKNNSDFAVLYNELDSWRKTEIAKIKATISDPIERQQAMSDLLTNETKALQSLQQLKLNAHKEIHVEKTTQMLRQMAQPHSWQLSHGETAQVHTPETQQAKMLLELYNALTAPIMSTEQRLDVLLRVKWAATETTAPQSAEIKELVDREADLLNRNRPIKTMEKLRQRLSSLFLQFVQNPAVNPRAQDFIKETM